MKTVKIWTDASGKNNGPTASCAVLVLGDMIRVVGGPNGTTTNNQAETLAVLLGIKTLKKPCKVVLKTDSQYVFYGLLRVVQLLKGKGKLLETNTEIWEDIYDAIRHGSHLVSVEIVEGHKNNILGPLPFNNMADVWSRWCVENNKAVNKLYNGEQSAFNDAPKKVVRGTRNSNGKAVAYTGS